MAENLEEKVLTKPKLRIMMPVIGPFLLKNSCGRKQFNSAEQFALYIIYQTTCTGAIMYEIYRTFF